MKNNMKSMANRNYNRDRDRKQHQAKQSLDDATVLSLLNMGTATDVDNALNQLERLIEANFRGLTSSQLRKLYADIANLPVDNPKKISQLRPQFAYLTARQPNDSAKYIMTLCDRLAKKAYEQENVHGFKKAMETIVAFHRFNELLFSRRVDLEKERRKIWQQLEPVTATDLLNFEMYSNPDDLLNKIEDLIRENARDITSTQLRNIYDKILSCDTANEVKALRPFFLYTAARQERLGAIRLLTLFTDLSKVIDADNNQLNAYKKIAQVIVSVHRYVEATAERSKGKSRYTRSDKLLADTLKFFEQPDARRLLKAMEATSNYKTIQQQLTQLLLRNMEGIKSSQLRRLYDAIQSAYPLEVETDKEKKKEQQLETLQNIKRLRPLFQYTLARQNNDKAKRIMLLLVEMIKALEGHQLSYFKQFMEDVVSYHKYFEVTVNHQFNSENLFL
jgi:CRISPR type III-A-associated protein Csm2